MASVEMDGHGPMAYKAHQQNGKIVSGFLWFLAFSGFPET